MSNAGPRAQVRDAAVWSLRTFRSNVLAFVALAALVAAVQFLQQISLQPLSEIVNQCADPQTPGQQAACADALAGRVLTSGALTLLFAVVGFAVTIGVVRAALRATRGIQPALDALLDGYNLGRFLLFQFAYAFLVGLGALLCLLPGLLVIFFFQFGPYYVLDRGLGVRAAFAASAGTVRRGLTSNAPAVLLVTALNAFVLVLGGVLFGLLTLLVLPLATLFTAYLYRAFNDEPVMG